MDDKKAPKYSDDLDSDRYEKLEDEQNRPPPYSSSDPRAPYSTLAAKPGTQQIGSAQGVADGGKTASDLTIEKEQRRIDEWTAGEEKRIAKWVKGERERAEMVRRKYHGDEEAEKIILRVEMEKIAAFERLKREQMAALKRARLPIGAAK